MSIFILSVLIHHSNLSLYILVCLPFIKWSACALYFEIWQYYQWVAISNWDKELYLYQTNSW